MNEFVKYLGVVFTRSALSVFKLFPVKKNRLFFSSYSGTQYSCNPKYITEYLCQNSPDKYEIVWGFINPEKYEELKAKGIKVVKYRSILSYYYMLTSRITISNVSGAGEVPKRKGIFEIQTWHGGGGGYKKSAGDDKTQSIYCLKRWSYDDSRYSLLCISSETSLKNTARGGLHFEGPVLGGTPRNDILVNHDSPELYREVRKKLAISEKNKILLYAPTWRKGNKSGQCSIDFDQLKKHLTKKFGGEWTVVYRFHPRARDVMKLTGTGLVNGNDYPDMQELLYATDVLITDYSSSIWDYSFLYRPCFLYCVDLKDFSSERDFYSPIRSWGFPIAESDEELYTMIEQFNNDEFIHNMQKHHEINGSFEQGHAAKDFSMIIESVCYGNGSLPDGLNIIH